MNLFTYLMAKSGNNSSVHGDLFSYLLGKGQSQTKTLSGVTIYIPDAKKTKIAELILDKESTQAGTPTPDNPIEVNTVKGYRNLFDKDNANKINGYIENNSGKIQSNNEAKVIWINIQPNTTYTVSKIASARFGIATYINQPVIGSTSTNCTNDFSATKLTITSRSTDNYLAVWYFSSADTLTEQEILDSIMIIKGNQELPYVPYGNNYVNVAVSDGNTTIQTPIPLNNNELVGIGTYKDELKVDKSGHCWLNKKIPKYIISGNENWQYYAGAKMFYWTGISDYLKIENTIMGLSNYYPVLIESSDATDFENITNDYNYAISFGYSSNTLRIKNIDFSNATGLKNWLSTYKPYIYFIRETPTMIDLNTTVDIRLFKGANTITNSEGCNMTIKYY